MIIAALLIGATVLFLGGLVFALADDGAGEAGWIGGLVATCAGPVAFFLVIAWPVNYFGSLGDVNDMRALRNSRPAIVRAIQQARDVTIAGANLDAGELVDLTYQQQANAYTALVTDCRAKVEKYNLDYQHVVSFKALPVFGPMRVGMPDDLKPLTGDFCDPDAEFVP